MQIPAAFTPEGHVLVPHYDFRTMTIVRR
jgi:hypothetical protein